MKICACCRVAQPLTNFGKKANQKDGLHYNCRGCRKVESDRRYKAKADAIKQVAIAYYFNNLEKAKEQRRAYYFGAYKEKALQNTRAWKKRNPADVNYYTQTRRANMKRRTPIWADKAAIREVYHLRDRLTKQTGILHHVDHIIPLRGELVSGFHCASNLRVVPAQENYVKNNHWVIE